MTDVVYKVATRTGHALFTDHGRALDYASHHRGTLYEYGGQYKLSGYVVMDESGIPRFSALTKEECEQHTASEDSHGWTIQEYFTKE